MKKICSICFINSKPEQCVGCKEEICKYCAGRPETKIYEHGLFKPKCTPCWNAEILLERINA